MFTWTGFYVGANAGFGGNEHSHPITFGRRTAAATPAGSFDLSLSGGLFGVQAGYNRQIGSFVVGAEADFAFTSIEGDRSILGTGLFPGGAGGGPATATFSSKIENLGTVRVRAGYAWDRALLYVTGGWAYGNVKSDIVASGGGARALDINYSKTNMHNGWAIGAGVEYAFTNNLTFKAEYLYVDLGKATIYSTTYRTGTTVLLEAEPKTHIVRAGLNYKF